MTNSRSVDPSTPPPYEGAFAAHILPQFPECVDVRIRIHNAVIEFCQHNPPGIKKNSQHCFLPGLTPERFCRALSGFWQPLFGLTPGFWIKQVHWGLITTHYFVQKVWVCSQMLQVFGGNPYSHPLLLVCQNSGHKLGHFLSEVEFLLHQAMCCRH